MMAPRSSWSTQMRLVTAPQAEVLWRNQALQSRNVWPHPVKDETRSGMVRLLVTVAIIPWPLHLGRGTPESSFCRGFPPSIMAKNASWTMRTPFHIFSSTPLDKKASMHFHFWAPIACAPCTNFIRTWDLQQERALWITSVHLERCFTWRGDNEKGKEKDREKASQYFLLPSVAYRVAKMKDFSTGYCFIRRSFNLLLVVVTL